MKNLLSNSLYLEDVKYVAAMELPWDKLLNKQILITGAGGLIGSFLVDVLMWRNKNAGMNCTIYAMGRNEIAAKERFSSYWEDSKFIFMKHDISSPLFGEVKFDYILHLASNTHPISYTTWPVSTITTNVTGTDNLLKYAIGHNCKRFLFASSNEIYGENRGDVELFTETYCGYINANTLRAGYPESKRCGEALCQAYLKEKGIDVVIPRFTRTYGPTMLMADTKAVSQFIKKAVKDEDIILKSEGNQFYSYAYVADAVAGLFIILLCGQCGEAYNIADNCSDIMLKDLAKIAANICQTEVVFHVPEEVEKAGYSTATKARLDGSKLKGLGWNMKYDIYAGMERTIKILKELNDQN